MSLLIRSILRRSGLIGIDQGAIDRFRSSLLLRSHEIHQNDPSAAAKLTQEDVDGWVEEVSAWGEDEMDEYVNKRINAQIIDMFTKIKPTMSFQHTMDDFDEDDEEDNDEEEEDEDLDEESYSKRDDVSLVDTVGFELERKESGIPDAGNGVFIRCRVNQNVAPGTVIALFPGLVHLKQFVSDGQYVVKNLLPDEEFMLMARTDGHIIDGRSAYQCAPNPYALAHLVNHVPPNSKPNVLQYPFDYPADPFGWYEFPKKVSMLFSLYITNP